jgi:hypothetical protein
VQEEGLGWDVSSLLAVFAPAFLELGVVFFISKFFFMAEDAELLVKRKEKKSSFDSFQFSPGRKA